MVALLSADQTRMATVIFQRIKKVVPLTSMMIVVRPVGEDILATLWWKDGDDWLVRTTAQAGTSDAQCHEVAVALMDRMCQMVVRCKAPALNRNNEECMGR